MMSSTVKRTPSWRRVHVLAEAVAVELSCTAEEMMGWTRDPRLMIGRWCVYWLARHGLQLRWSQLRKVVNRDHSTCLVQVRRFGEIMVEDNVWRERAYRVLDNIAEDTDDHVLAESLRRAKNGEVVGATDEVTSVTWDDKHGFYGTNRSYFKRQDDNFQAAVRRALQDSEAQGTSKQGGASKKSSE